MYVFFFIPSAEDKSFVKATSVDNDTSNLCVSPNLPCQTHLDGRDFNSENLELSPISNLSSSIGELLQTYAPGSVGSSFARSTVINKLLVWMGNISKELEVTESEIEALEIELKSLITESGKTCPCPAASSSLLGECVAKPCEELVAATNIIPRPSSLLLDSSGDMIVERADGGLVDKRGQAGDEDVDSPGTATSKFVGLLSSTKGAAMSDPVICGDVNSSKSGNFEMKCSLHGSNEETTCCASSSEVGYQLIASKSSAPQVGMSSQCYSDDMLYDQIVASNKGSASRASEVLDKLLPSRTRSFCSWASNAMIQEKFVKRNRFLKFRERVITLLFRAMQQLWKEDMRLLSIKKNQAKSQKRSELILCTQNGSYQKHRSSIRSRFASSVNSVLVGWNLRESPRLNSTLATVPRPYVPPPGCDFRHWLVVMHGPVGDRTRDEIIDSFIKTLAKVLGSEEKARMKIYSVSTRHYCAFGAEVEESDAIAMKELPGVRWVIPDAYVDVENELYGDEPFINGQAVPYDPKYHKQWTSTNNYE